MAGHVEDLSPEGLRLVSTAAVAAGTAVTVHCSFGAMCQLELIGEVVFCRGRGDDAAPYVIGLKFSRVRNWQRRMFELAVEQLARPASSLEESLVTVLVAKDALALDRPEFYARRPRSISGEAVRVRRSSRHASKIVAWGAHLPPARITNDDINALVAVRGQRTHIGDIVGRLTGAELRRYAGSPVAPSDLAVEASRLALRRAGVDPRDIEVVVSCGISRDVEEPPTACIIQEKLGAHHAYAFDLSNACNGFVSGLDVLDAFIASGRCEIGLVTAGEVTSQAINWDPSSPDDLRLSAMGYTLGDGGGAAVLCRAEEGEARGIKARWFLSDGSYWQAAVAPLDEHSKRVFRSNAAEMERAALEHIPRGVEEIMEMLAWHLDDLDLIIPHQVSARIIESLFFKRLGLPRDKVWWSFPKHGNVGAASMPVALCEAREAGRLDPGHRVLLVGGSGGFGAGLMGLVF